MIFTRTGRWARREALGPRQVSGNSAGLHRLGPEWIRELDVAFVGSEAATDVMPSMARAARLAPQPDRGVLSRSHAVDRPPRAS